ncbi:MAG: membrane protein insertase YidC [Candidatus Marinimicrobia bacterium]|nr:membrane protein insertase YidC [Candidatus Neomarinimicrobiota bacterium]
MDRKSILGFILIFVIIMAMPYYYKTISKKAPGAPTETSQESRPSQITSKETSPITTETQSIHHPEVSSGRAVASPADTLTIETDLYRLKISSQGGGTITSVTLKNYNMISGRDTSLVELVPTSEGQRLYLKYITSNGDPGLIDQNFSVLPGRPQDSKNYFRLNNNDSLTITFALKSGKNILVKRAFTFYGNQYIIQTINDLDGMQDDMASDKYELIWEGGLAYTEALLKDDVFYSKASAFGGGETDNLDIKSGKSGQTNLIGATQWTAIKTKYFAAAFIPNRSAEGYRLTGTGAPIKGKDFLKVFNMYLTLSASSAAEVKIFLGPLDYSIVKDIAPSFDKLMNFGFSLIRPISKAVLWVFTTMHRVIPNYGWVLIIFSILLKIGLTPLTNTSTRSMKEMQKLQPQIALLHEKYGSDPQRENTEKMKLFREHNINPMGGCLPILLQMPILWALFIVFRTTIELRQAPFIFWITDLSAPDTIFTLPFAIPIYGSQVNVLPIIMALSQFVQQKISGASGNQQQKVMMYFMTVFFFFLFNQFPSGLNLYYTLYNVLSIVQQKYFPPKPKPKKARKSTLENLRQYQMKMKRR